jgi:hypothetical protein
MLGCVCCLCLFVFGGGTFIPRLAGVCLVGGVIDFLVVCCVVLCCVNKQGGRGGGEGSIRWGRSGVMSTDRLTKLIGSINQ